MFVRYESKAKREVSCACRGSIRGTTKTKTVSRSGSCSKRAKVRSHFPLYISFPVFGGRSYFHFHFLPKLLNFHFLSNKSDQDTVPHLLQESESWLSLHPSLIPFLSFVACHCFTLMRIRVRSHFPFYISLFII